MCMPTLSDKTRNVNLFATGYVVDKETLSKGCKVLQKCAEMINKLGLFKEEINTAKLNFIYRVLIMGIGHILSC
ncbi:hypothetical protein HanRHA438_Chr02g0049121 [Helianthus annuus]|nr:hypothetical protein HanHA300_Chr02g0039301 [Helianthus annuus]KAJ0617442.1 hypothetical protein HanHA89_Chr02g0041961 [Helianthus annuus]KAJ0775983.1 hypothetical protein HanLR1_Chr02g0040521 [Helianthus annuus]KAJ0938370.1 hypothetical protein HanRHA438_Chr02g0049121 [Helianthus annuus]